MCTWEPIPLLFLKVPLDSNFILLLQTNITLSPPPPNLSSGIQSFFNPSALLQPCWLDGIRIFLEQLVLVLLTWKLPHLLVNHYLHSTFDFLSTNLSECELWEYLLPGCMLVILAGSGIVTETHCGILLSNPYFVSMLFKNVECNKMLRESIYTLSCHFLHCLS